MNNPLKEFRPESLCLLKETQDYWCYSRKGQHDFSIYTEKSSIYETPTKEKFRESSDVLVRWTDGLLYLATIIKVEDEYSRCAVKFEDGSQFWALYKDIHKGPLPDNEFACTVCDSASSQPPDEIVICDKCAVGYHQSCHIPKISTSDLNPDLSWNCRKCVFAAATKRGGASKKGPNAQALMLMKETLPYEPQSLTWDTSHRSNLQQTYCYCGGPGEWYSKMLQCLRCKQWFHEACLQCLDEPLLYGDRFYIFVCSLCNKGPEFLRRLSVRWPDIAHLVLFNLTVTHGKKFFEFDTKIMSFLKENWSQFQIKGEVLSRMPHEDKKKKLLEALQNSKSRFTSGKEMKKKSEMWGLRSRIPPPMPAVTLPTSGTITDEVLDSQSSSRKSKSSGQFSKSNGTPISTKRARKFSSADEDLIIIEPSPKVQKVENGVSKAQKIPNGFSKAHKVENGISKIQKVENGIPKVQKIENGIPKVQKIENGIQKVQKVENGIQKVQKVENGISKVQKVENSIPKAQKVENSVPLVLEKRDHPFRRKNENIVPSNKEEKKTPQIKKKLEKPSVTPVEEKIQLRKKSEKPLPPPNVDDEKSKKAILLPKKKERRKLPHRLARNLVKPNAIKKIPRSSPILIDLSESDDTTSSHGTLNTVIPHPTDFEGMNNPFLSNYSSTSSTSASATSVSSANNLKSRSRPRKRNNCVKVKVCPTRKFTPSRSSTSVINGLLNHTPNNNEKSHQSPTAITTPNSDISSSVSSYFGMADRIANGEKFSVLAKRTTADGQTQYLVEWDCPSPS